MNSKIFTIIVHEYITKIKSKGFIIGTFLGPFLMVAVIAVPIVAAVLSQGSTDRKIAILDKTEYNIGKEVVESDTSKYFLTSETETVMQAQILKDELDGYCLISRDIVETGTAFLFSKGGGGLGFMESIHDALRPIVMHKRLEIAGVDTSVIRLVQAGISIETRKITEQGTKKDYTEEMAIIGYFFGLVIYMLMFIYGGFVSRGVIEEKANRIVEVIASSAKPFEIMMGKVLGIGLVGLTQMIVWVVLSGAVLLAAGPIVASFVDDPNELAKGMSAPGQTTNIPIMKEAVTKIDNSKAQIFDGNKVIFSGSIENVAPGDLLYVKNSVKGNNGKYKIAQINKNTIILDGVPLKASETTICSVGTPPNLDLPSISGWVILALIFYFLAGYFIYATLFAAVGSAVDQESDAAQLQMPITLPIIIPILFISVIMSNPDGAVAVVMSLIPFFSPILMIVRITATKVPIWQIAASVILMAATFFGAIWLAAKIYRVGILMYGKKPSFKDIYKWIKIAD